MADRPVSDWGQLLCLCFGNRFVESLRVGFAEDIDFLLFLTLARFDFFLRISDRQIFRPLAIITFPHRRDSVHDPDGTSSINTCRDPFLVHALILLLVAAQILELSLYLTRNQQFLCGWLDSEQIDVLRVELFKSYRVEAERW